MPTDPRETPIASHTHAERPPSVLALMLSPCMLWAALKVLPVVGSVLNVVDNGVQFRARHTVNPGQLALNFVVPLCVSGYRAARNEARRGEGG